MNIASFFSRYNNKMVSLLGILFLTLPQIIFASNELLVMQKNPNLWVMQLGNYSGHRYSHLEQINRNNVNKLSPNWSLSTGVLRGHAGGTLVIGDIMYIHTPFPNKVLALDLDREGQILWKYEPSQNSSIIAMMSKDTINLGLSYSNSKIFLYQADTTLLALDAKTGKVIWKTVNGNPKIGETATNSAFIAKDKVLVGISGDEFGIRGHITAYDINSGKRVWRAYSTGADVDILIDKEKTTHLAKPIGSNSSLSSWEQEQWKTGGGAVSGYFTYDPDLNLIFYGTGSPAAWNPKQRPGANRWSSTIMARDIDTGIAKWFYQVTPHDQWNYGGTNEMILLDVKLQGKMRKALIHFNQNGFAYTLDRATGTLLAANKYDYSTNWAAKIDLDSGLPQIVPRYSTEHNGEDVNTTHICPAALGTKNHQPAAYSPKTGLFYVPTNHICMDYEPYKVSYTSGEPFMGATLSMYPPTGDNNLGNFIAWNPIQNKIAWAKKEAFAVWSGALATAGDIVFYGTLDGFIKAIDQKNGKELWKFKTSSGIISNINTYMHDGKQYITVISGIGGWPGIGLAANLDNDSDGLGAVGAFKDLGNHTQLGGAVTVFSLP